MADDNTEQIAEWNGEQGRRWAAADALLEPLVGPFGDAALALAAAQAGERVLDIGCGCGATSLALARQVGPTGRVLGVDISQPMLDLARGRAVAQGLAHLAFQQADASAVALPAETDLLFSRFGLMFFAQPAAAFAHLRAALRPGGRLAFVCWRGPRDNPWAMAPLMAARQALGIQPPPADRNAPGPFALADEDRLRGLLAEAGWQDVSLQRVDHALPIGGSPRIAAERMLDIGPVSRLAREVGPAHTVTLVEAITASLAPLAEADGTVRLGGSAWAVTARRAA